MTIENDSTSYLLFIAVLLIALTTLLIIKVRRRKGSAKSIVYQQYAHLELSQSKQQIGLYSRHQKVTDTIINLADIKQLDILLNKNKICTINTETTHGFDDDKELDLRVIFKKEHVHKMMQGRIRQVTLAITDKSKQPKNVCVYLRKGSDRITKNSYRRVIDNVVDWCWLVATEINPTQTTIRKVQSQKYDKPLHIQTSEIAVAPAIKKETTPLESIPLNETPVDTLATTEHSANNNNADSNDIVIDTELVDALEKLVKLRQQGFLTLAEFTQAKTKLLKSLIEN